ncbi:MAG: phosphoadenylyl-sulfate reductase [Sulfuricurvum sp.]|uniref:phosphoadenylyl-sulfate reductase n=1 Tax=Sulfuricurvum sp. TaxID=2025608 RepID=UPI0025FDEE6E|nr:phosphoadenylyl-sulfate reductase [Sulfuricurvum sp.]MCK9373860.1 phosphoadenylyl-sulfate reductase [Sulfuricurvum sp.]
MKDSIELLNMWLEDVPIEKVLGYFLKTYGGKIGLASSFGAEDQVLSDLILRTDPNAKIFTLDTGRLPEETYTVMEQTNRKYGIKIDVYFPKDSDVEALCYAQGINGFKESIENRQECCRIRKIAPLKRALEPLDVWITGLRRSQSPTRETMRLVEWDEANGLMKLNPLIEWSEEKIWDYIKSYEIPYNALHAQGYPSIGCAPCTRAIGEGEDLRAGRWWWENPEHKECGLHLRGGK